LSIEWGITSGRWMTQHMIARADPLYLKKAVIDLVDAFEQTDSMSQLEVLDRIMQVAMTGKYIAPEYEDEVISSAVFDLKDGKLSPEDEAEVQKLVDTLDQMLGKSSPEDKSFEDFLKEREQDDEDD